MKKPAITIYPIIKKEKRYRHQSQSLLINDPVHIQVPDHLQQMKIEHIRARKRFKRLVEERVAKSTRLVISIFLLHNLKSCSQQTDCLFLGWEVVFTVFPQSSSLQQKASPFRAGMNRKNL
jgi:hypothetical protein